MKTILKLTLLALVFVTISCKQEVTIENKYSDKAPKPTCSLPNATLLNEAIYSFENDIDVFYSKGKSNLSRAYSSFINSSISNRVKFEDVVSKHSLDVLKALKAESNLWSQNGANTTLNYNSDVFKCIAGNIQDKNLKTTFNALLSTNSMRPDLTAPALRTQAGRLLRDKDLSAYVALEFYYAKLFNFDASTINFEKREADRIEAEKKAKEAKEKREQQMKERAEQQKNGKVDFNKTPRK